MALGKPIRDKKDFYSRLKGEAVKFPSAAKVSIFQAKQGASLVSHLQKHAKLPQGKPLSRKQALDLLKKIKKMNDPRTIENFLRQQGYNPSQRQKILYERLSSSKIKVMAWQVLKNYKTEEKRKSELKKLGLNSEQIRKVLRASRELVVSDDLKEKDKSALKELGLGYDAKKKRLATILGKKLKKVLSGSRLLGQQEAKPSVGHQVGGSILAGEKKGALATIGEVTDVTSGFKTSSGKKLGKEKSSANTFKNIKTIRPPM